MRQAVILFNLGGPENLTAVQPFLRHLFSDPAIIAVPQPMRSILAWLISRLRARKAREIYTAIGGGSPLLKETQAQAAALEASLGDETKVFVSMRYAPPFSDETARAVKNFDPERVVLLPLYPQFSTTTTASSLKDWQRAAKAVGLHAPQTHVCCYPDVDGFIAAMADLTTSAQARCKAGISYRYLFSAHGLPQKIIDKGDPYQVQVERTSAALAQKLGLNDYTVCYQSRVGPVKWIGPATEEEILRAGKEGKGIILVPVAFVSEHSETLYELDMAYAEEAQACGVPDYIRVPTVGVHTDFIAALTHLVQECTASQQDVRTKICSADKVCGFR